jgi:ribosome-binding protein aMBF1 (putative translation factor)
MGSVFSHLLAEHNNPAWLDQGFEGEKLKLELEQMVKDYEKRVQREKEENGILVPKLPCKCTNWKETITES